MFGFDDPNFWTNFAPNFWANLLADVVVIVLFGGWLYRRLTERWDAQLLARYRGTDGEKARFELILDNTGPRSFDASDVYWHIIIAKSLDPVVLHRSGVVQFADDTGAVFHYTGDLPRPAFPATTTKLDIFVEVKMPDLPEIQVLYFLSTAHGLLPKTVKRDQQGRIFNSSLAKLQLTVSQQGNSVANP